ncbi:hypothetical protein ACNKHS_05420 [Shigella flexneri]
MKQEAERLLADFCKRQGKNSIDGSSAAPGAGACIAARPIPVLNASDERMTLGQELEQL